jgi:hypothetical protein
MSFQGSLRMFQSQGGQTNFFEVYLMYIEKKFVQSNKVASEGRKIKFT